MNAIRLKMSHKSSILRPTSIQNIPITPSVLLSIYLLCYMRTNDCGQADKWQKELMSIYELNYGWQSHLVIMPRAAAPTLTSVPRNQLRFLTTVAETSGTKTSRPKYTGWTSNGDTAVILEILAPYSVLQDHLILMAVTRGMWHKSNPYNYRAMICESAVFAVPRCPSVCMSVTSSC